MQLHDVEELGAARARFAVVAANWRLGSADAAALLGLEGDWAGRSLMEIVVAVGIGGERSMRLVCEVDRLIDRLVPYSAIPTWLRQPEVGYEDETVTPLQALSSGPSAVRSLRDYLQTLPCIQARAIG